MEVIPSYDQQVDFLKEKGLNVENLGELRDFLIKYPFQKSIKQLGIFYSEDIREYEEYNCFKGKTLEELKKDILELYNTSSCFFKEILFIEMEIKNKIFFLLLEYYKKEIEKYESIVSRINRNSYRGLRYLDINEEDYSKKIYKVINVLTMGDIGKILDSLNEEKEIKYIYNFFNDKFNINSSIYKGEEKVKLKNKDLNSLDKNKFKKVLEIEIRRSLKNIIFKKNIKNIDYNKLNKCNILSLLNENVMKEYYNTLDKIGYEIDFKTKKKEIQYNLINNKKLIELARNIILLKGDDLIEKLSVSERKETIISQSNELKIFIISAIEIDVKKSIINKYFGTLISFRNLVAHGNTILINLKNDKEKVIKEDILKTILEDKSQKYIDVIYKINKNRV